MSNCGSPRCSEDSDVVRERERYSEYLLLQTEQGYEDYKTKPIEHAFKDLEKDLSIFQSKPRASLLTIFEESISPDPNKPFYIHLALTAAYAPFSTTFCGPHVKSLIHLDFSLWKLTQPPLKNLRIGKIMLLRLVLINFWDYVLGDYLDVVEGIVRRVDAEFHRESDGEDEKGLKRLFKRKKRTVRKFEVDEIEAEAKRFAQTELSQFLRLFDFIVHLRAPSVEQTLLRYLEPLPEDYEVDEEGNRIGFVETVSWKKARAYKRREMEQRGVNCWWAGSGEGEGRGGEGEDV